eukprot:4824076-Amphidinium_carterae.1
MGPLRNLRIAPPTARRYGGALQLFFGWLHVAHPEPVRSVDAIGRALCEYLEMLWDEGVPKGRA